MEMEVFCAGNRIYINNPLSSPLNVKVFDVYGKVVVDTEIWDNGLQSLAMNRKAGAYLVRVFAGEQVFSHEISLR